MPGHRNHLRAASGTAHTPGESRGSSQAGEQRDERIGTSPDIQPPGNLGDCDGPRAVDWGGPAAAEFSTAIGSGAGFPRGPYPDDGGAAGGTALYAGQAAFAGRVDPDWTKAVPTIRANRGAHQR